MRAWPLNILIIKLGALGDFVQATTAFSAIRQHDPDAQLTLLTTAPYQDFAKRLGYFDHIILDTRPKWHQFNRLKTLIKTLRASQFDTVYDLQDVDRTRLYRRFLPRTTLWISHPRTKTPQHPQERFQQMFESLEIDFSANLDLTTLAESIDAPLRSPYALLIPGASNAHGGLKRWPEKCYAQLAQHLVEQGIQPVIMGGPGEAFPFIQHYAPESIDLVGKTTFYQIIGLAQKAAFAVGNDTGPMLLAASGGCPTLTLYSRTNPSSIGGPKGDKNSSIQVDNLQDLNVKIVLENINSITYL
jgi:ADP-heptose:LPS heptosyltransferase